MPSTGPQRTQKVSPRASPYSGPSLGVERSSTPVSPSSSLSSVHSLLSISSELEYDTDREHLARSRRTRRRQSLAYDSDDGVQLSRANGTKQSSNSLADVTTNVCHNADTQSTKPGRKHGPPALVFEDDSDDDLIPKPPGEVGRPNRGGYSLFLVLGWPKKKYDKVKNFINDLVEKHLDCGLPMSEQAREDLKKATEKFVFLKEYSGLWVTNNFIRNHLKYQKTVIRKEKLEKIAADVERPAASTASSPSAPTKTSNRSGTKNRKHIS
ncbi:MAG: hypothetical protein NXY57DRAFT_965784 [Lentinula lateritia]|nr:MAG: hypothetical protein NXY57DRAFT_965784 [Lentinula lateritia]